MKLSETTLFSANTEFAKLSDTSNISKFAQLDMTDLSTVLSADEIEKQAAVVIQRKYESQVQREEEDAVKGQAVKEEALKTNDMVNEKQIKEYKVTDENKHLAQVDSSLTLDLDYTTIAKSGTPERKKYENQIANDFSHSLGIHKDRFEIKSIKQAS